MRFGRLAPVWIALVVFVSLLGHWAQAQDQAGEWSDPVELSEEKWAWFPVIAVDPGGTVHAMWAWTRDQETASAAPESLFYSWWNGSSWSRPVDVLVSPSGGYAHDPDLTADRGGNLHVIWNDGTFFWYSRASASKAASAQGWASPVRLASGSYAAASIVADGAGVLHVAYPEPTTGVYYIDSIDGGNTWSQPVEVWRTASEKLGATSSRLAIGANRTIHVVWTEIYLPETYPPLGVYYARSLDGGQTWSEPLQVAGEDYAEGNLLTTGDDTVHLVWHGRAGIGGTFHQWSSDGGRTWSTPTRVLNGTGLTRAPALSVDSAHVVHLAEIDSSGLVYTSWREGTWDAPTLIDSLKTNYEPHHPALAVSEGNKLFVVWASQSTGQGTGVVRYSTRQVAAPYVPPEVLPTLLPTPTTRPSPTLLSTTSPTSLPTASPLPLPSASSSGMPPQDDQSFLAIIVGVVPAGLILLVILFVRIGRSSIRKA